VPAFLERVADGVFILRVGPHAERYGDPYTVSATIVALGDGICEVKGMTRRYDDDLSSFAINRDVKCCLAEAGFSQMVWERRRALGRRRTQRL
jgi:hypothetical protein